LCVYSFPDLLHLSFQIRYTYVWSMMELSKIKFVFHGICEKTNAFSSRWNRFKKKSEKSYLNVSYRLLIQNN
jgi:hypothetical protein